MPSTTIARGNAISTFYISAPLAPAAVSSTSSNQTFTVQGIQSTDQIIIVGVVGTQTAGIVYAEAEATAANTVQIQFANISGSSATPVTGNYVMQIIRPENLPLPASAV
jgi:hypothetical protein